MPDRFMPTPALNSRVGPLAALIALTGLAPLTPALADTTLETVVVPASAEAPAGVDVARERDATVYTLDAGALRTLAAPGGTNPYLSAAELPSVQAPGVDAWGLVNVPGAFKGLRVRGENTSHGGNGTIDGIPLTGINPGPGYQWMFDAENLAGISLAQGPIPPDRIDFFNTAGALDSRLRWPEEAMGGQISMGLGSDGFQRLFGRFDSGRSALGTAVFGSASTTTADKWRGPGEAPDHLRKVAVAVDQDAGDLDARLMLVHSEMAQDQYRPLNYDQASNLSEYRDFDYAERSSTAPSEAIYYQGYNRQSFTNSAVIGQLRYAFTDTTHLTIKPFYAKEEGSYWSGMANNNRVREWEMDHDWYGVVGELATRLGETDVKVGYWWESLEPPGPPTRWKLYATQADGSLRFTNWALLAENTSRQKYESIYALAQRRFGALRLEAGAREVWVTLPGIDAYNTAGVTAQDFDTALDQSTGVVPGRSADGHTDAVFLPFASLGYTLNAHWSLRAAIGRNVGATSLGAWPQFQSNYAAFAAHGVTAQDIWDKVRPSTANALDLSLRYETERLFLQPTVYYARHHGKDLSYYDPSVGVAYSQNVGESQAMGIQLAGGWQLASTVRLFGSASWGSEKLVENVVTAGGAELAVKGKQMPDVPRVIASLGARWQPAPGWSVDPLVHYTAKRYADSMHQEKVGGYTRVDLSVSKRSTTSWGALTGTVALINLFDRKYIGLITASDVQGSGAFSYYPGAPRTVLASVELGF